MPRSVPADSTYLSYQIRSSSSFSPGGTFSGRTSWARERRSVELSKRLPTDDRRSLDGTPHHSGTAIVRHSAAVTTSAMCWLRRRIRLKGKGRCETWHPLTGAA